MTEEVYPLGTCTYCGALFEQCEEALDDPQRYDLCCPQCWHPTTDPRYAEWMREDPFAQGEER